MSETLSRTLAPEIRVLNAEKGLVEYIASDETLDSYSEIIRAAGWRFDQRFTSNPVFVDSHSYWGIRDVLGKVVEWKVDGKKLVEVVQWAIDVSENALARLGFEMTAKGYLKAVSVGFIPTRAIRREDADFTKCCDEMGLETSARDAVRRIFWEQQQIELSACVIGANPAALAKAYDDRSIERGLFDSVGLGGDEGAEVIGVAGGIFDKHPDEAVRKLAALTLRSFATNNLSAKGPGGRVTHQPGRGGAGEKDHRPHVDRRWMKDVARELGVI